MRYVLLCLALPLTIIFGACSPLITTIPITEEAAPVSVTPFIAPESDDPVRILFIGNTHTSTNKGLDAHLAAMSTAADLPFAVETASVTETGASLGELWASGHAAEAIRQGSWDFVLLQAAEPSQAQEFHAAVEQFGDTIKESGAQPILLALRDANSESAAQSVHQTAAALSLPLIDPRPAWRDGELVLSDLPLEDAEYEGYPSIAGTYLDTAVIYAALFGQSPEGLAYRPVDLLPEPEGEASGVVIVYAAIHDEWTISDADAAVLQQVAWQAVQDGAVNKR